MDSFTQIALGASVGIAVMGRRQPVWKSALFGAVAGTLPDLDVFIDYGDPVANMVRHRAETHSLFWQTLAAPVVALVFGVLARRIDLFLRWWVMVWLVLITHAGLDAMTIYGTKLLLPRDDAPFGVGSIFIIDPLYTLALLLGIVLAWRSRSPRGRRWNLAGLALSSAYLVWSWQAQQHVTALVMKTPAAATLTAHEVLVTPTPFNTLLWRIVLRHPDRYEEGFYSLLDPLADPDRAIRFTAFDHDEALDRATAGLASGDAIRHFSKGFYGVNEQGGSVRIADLRMGQAPHYVFSFEIARREAGRLVAIEPVDRGERAGAGGIGALFNWLARRVAGQDIDPPR